MVALMSRWAMSAVLVNVSTDATIGTSFKRPPLRIVTFVVLFRKVAGQLRPVVTLWGPRRWQLVRPLQAWIW